MAVRRPSLPPVLPVLVLLCVLLPTEARAQEGTGPDMDWRRGAVEGRVVDAETGEGIPGQTIRLTWVTTRGTSRYPYPWVPEIDQGRAPGVEAVSDGEGRFRFDDLGLGRFRLRAGLPLAVPAPVLEITRDAPDLEAELQVSLGRHLRGTVLDSTGAPVAGAFLFLSGREAEDGGNALWNERPHGRETVDDGSALLAGLPGGTLWIEAFHPDHGFSPPGRLAAGAESLTLVLRDELDRLVSMEVREFGGIGIQIGGSAVGPRVEGVTEGLPAHEAGMRTGDVIRSIDGLDTRFMVRDEFIMRCRGAVGTRVTLGIDRGAESREIELTRVALD